MNEELLSAVEMKPPAEARASVVWLHGLGADGHDFEGIVPYLGLPPGHGIRFVFPHAPAIPVTINGGLVMPAWYDITHEDLGKRHDAEGVRRSAERVAALLAREAERGIPPSRTVLAGFSQGGAIALYLGLRRPQKLAGVMALSTYLVWDPPEDDALSPANRGTPVFLAHGEHDPLVPLAGGESARRRLAALGYPVEWRTYPIQHQVSLEEIREVGAWLLRVLDEEAG